MKDEISFFDKVFKVVRLIPKGRVSTYGAVANYLDLGSARMVGWAMNKSFSLEDPVPAHRVVNRKGELTGRNHFSTPDRMRQLLEDEDIRVKNETVQDFETIFWDPNLEL